jgi:hypothetical protein
MVMATSNKAAANETTESAEAPVKAEPNTPPVGENRSSLPESQRPPGDLRRRVGVSRRKGPFVKYVGAAAVRRITALQWKSLNINLKKDDDGNVAESVWAIGNEKMLEANRFSDEQLDYLLIDDMQQGTPAHAFLLVDYDEDGQLVQAVYE